MESYKRIINDLSEDLLNLSNSDNTIGINLILGQKPGYFFESLLYKSTEIKNDVDSGKDEWNSYFVKIIEEMYFFYSDILILPEQKMLVVGFLLELCKISENLNTTKCSGYYYIDIKKRVLVKKELFQNSLQICMIEFLSLNILDHRDIQDVLEIINDIELEQLNRNLIRDEENSNTFTKTFEYFRGVKKILESKILMKGKKILTEKYKSIGINTRFNFSNRLTEADTFEKLWQGLDKFNYLNFLEVLIKNKYIERKSLKLTWVASGADMAGLLNVLEVKKLFDFQQFTNKELYRIVNTMCNLTVTSDSIDKGKISESNQKITGKLHSLFVDWKSS